MPQPKSNEEIIAKLKNEWLEGSGVSVIEFIELFVSKALAQKDAEVADREKYVPRFKGINIFSGEQVEGAGCYTSEKGTAFILEDNNGEEPIFTPVKEINYNWYTPKE